MGLGPAPWPAPNPAVLRPPTYRRVIRSNNKISSSHEIMAAAVDTAAAAAAAADSDNDIAAGDVAAAAAAEDEDEDEVGVEANRCPICLSQMLAAERAAIEGCFHMFCFQCIMQWCASAVSAAGGAQPLCPLCKGAAEALIHDIRSDTIYSRHALPPHAVPAAAGATGGGAARHSGAARRGQQHRATVRWGVRAGRASEPGAAAASVAAAARERQQAEQILSRRRRIYAQGLWSTRPAEVNRQRCHRSAAWGGGAAGLGGGWLRWRQGAAGPALLGWLRRELRAAWGFDEVADDDVDVVANFTLTLVEREGLPFFRPEPPGAVPDGASAAAAGQRLAVALRPFLFERAEHFLHELYAFGLARPDSIEAYDRASRAHYPNFAPQPLAEQQPAGAAGPPNQPVGAAAGVAVGGVGGAAGAGAAAGPMPGFERAQVELSAADRQYAEYLAWREEDAVQQAIQQPAALSSEADVAPSSSTGTNDAAVGGINHDAAVGRTDRSRRSARSRRRSNSTGGEDGGGGEGTSGALCALAAQPIPGSRKRRRRHSSREDDNLRTDRDAAVEGVARGEGGPAAKQRAGGGHLPPDTEASTVRVGGWEEDDATFFAMLLELGPSSTQGRAPSNGNCKQLHALTLPALDRFGNPTGGGDDAPSDRPREVRAAALCQALPTADGRQARSSDRQ